MEIPNRVQLATKTEHYILPYRQKLISPQDIEIQIMAFNAFPLPNPDAKTKRL